MKAGKKPYNTIANPPMYSYKLELDKKTKEKLLTFPLANPMPLEYVEDIVNSCKKSKLKGKEMQVGIAIVIPNVFNGKKLKLKSGSFGHKQTAKKFHKKSRG